MDSVWLGTKLPEFPRLKEDIHADVLIIGGGGHRTGMKGGGWCSLYRTVFKADTKSLRGMWIQQMGNDGGYGFCDDTPGSGVR